ncbi:WD domain, G-beta repeat protein [Talaromyces stipitatus ATCC 10500]|uniref:WD domain, G-beta repeat protein n=1 Tax=Talaromyces stipitatus (strain ATCC 10500 / CBS 375.48 / QM 6759 / NRRL 1006) TaxID=441959 RepID=B8MQ59_TALSN|nr:WD domain, G-beta repeat protein [Talaromyces stipitatus ATCC 10500]EED13085.1 WD domain, G-beta repeat protein [Talaromyces stipitatus ATCC 10500]
MSDLSSWHRPVGSTTQSTAPATPLDPAWDSEFQPCASTASLFLFSQGSVILCLHHDTLAIERRFTLHEERIAFICVDNVSERGAGRLVVSYDFAQTAIVWDLFTGSEISRFASYEPLRVAAWMRNGNVAFGNGKGDVILFEPSTSEHLSARTIFDPITSLAPSADCRTYAIGYQNGSILIATLHPAFTILHTLSTSRGPSPIVCLAWHASSSKQKSDMLATQTLDGDLRVWSVAKAPLNESPRVIRALKRTEPYSTGPKWIAWSKNGRIVQYSDRETWVWDVRTKHVTYVTIPTIEDVLGMANYGPTATLFTLGPNNTVQQYDLENPAMVKNVRHLPMDQIALVEESKVRPMSPSYFSRSGTRSAQGFRGPEVSIQELASQQRAATASPMSARSRTNSISSHASSGRVRPFSPVNKSTYSGTTFSMTSPLGRLPSQSGTSIAYGSTASVSSVRSRGGSRLRNEITQSPVDKPLVDLFPFTRERVNEVSYMQQLPPLDESRLTPEALRQQMLRVVFGWEGDIEGLIRDELSRHPPASQNAIFLSRWLGENDPMQMMAMLSSGPVNSSAWMFLALSQMGGEEQANKVGQSFVQRLLEIGDIHASATILLALGDRNDAIEVYVSRNYYMEAILMTCLLLPNDWQRQSYLVRRWGEHVVSNAQQQLAIRCFMCTGAEPSEPWMSPTAPNAPYRELHVASPVSEPPPKPVDQMLKPESANRMTVKNSALKLITSFGPQGNQAFKFPGLKSDDRTPTNAPGITPIAESAVGESALSPGGLGSYRLNNARSLNNALSRVGTPSHAHRHRLPSIGETPVDVHPPNFPPRSLPTPVDSSSEKGKRNISQSDPNESSDNNDAPILLLSSARYEPAKDSHGPSPQTAVQTGANKFENIKGLPSPAAGVFETLKGQAAARNGSRDRKPEGLHIQWPPVDTSESEAGPYTGGTGGGTPSSVFQSLRSTKSPSVSSRSIDQYISSLDEANYYANVHRPHTKTRRHEAGSEHGKKSSRNGSVDSRGRATNRYIAPAKRSPSSPVPMSPEEFAKYNASVESLSAEITKRRSRSHTKGSSRVRASSKADRHQRSTSRGIERKHKVKSRNSSRRSRGRSGDRSKSGVRSPTSPLPMSPAEDMRGFEDSLRFVTSDRERLHRSRQRSSSRRRGTSSVRRDTSPDKRRPRARSSSRQAREPNQSVETPSEVILSNESFVEESSRPEFSSTSNMVLSAHERAKRELAAAELEARRLSLARRPSAPKIPHPGDFQTAAMMSAVGGNLPESPPSSGGSFNKRIRSKSNASKRSPTFANGSDSGSSTRGRSGTVGLPATPKAMRRPKYSDGYVDGEAPAMPEIPLTLPSTVYQDEAAKISRSMSVPVVEFHQTPVPADLPHHPRFIPSMPRSRSTSRTRGPGPRGHRRENSSELGQSTFGSPPSVSVSIEPDIIVDNTKIVPPILPELQHLTTPPPPPPAPNAGTRGRDIESSQIMTDNSRAGYELARPMTTGADAQSMRRMSVDHRRGRSINETFASKFRNFTGRMRSTSRGPGVQSPPTESFDKNASPYESVTIAKD